MGNASTEYLPLVSDACPQEDGLGPHRRRTVGRLRSLREILLVLVILLQTALLVCLAYTRRSDVAVACQCPHREPLLYSPADAVLEHEVRVFTDGHNTRTIYQGLSEETDRAWGRLYNHTIMKIPKSEAALLPNKTWPIVTEPGYYIASLDVFHQLHCLNHIRRALHKDHYADDETLLGHDHISHCVDSIRQSLMCNADVSVNVWQWDQNLSAVVGHSSQAHSCRNFERLLDWTLERQLEEWIDIRQYVEDDLPNPPVISA